MNQKPQILLLVDRPGWAFDAAAQAMVKHLSKEFEFRIEYVIQTPDLTQWPFDLIYVFFWGETYHQKYINDPRRVIKEVSSHRWALEEQYGLLSPAQMVQTYLQDAGTAVAISQRLQRILSPYREVLWAPNGYEPGRFYDQNQPKGRLRIGWAGNIADPCKGVNDILIPAAGEDFDFHVAGGGMNYSNMLEFYNSIDVICVASTAEGEPLTLLEAMACGCYPVGVDVGIVPELVTHLQNGMIVNRSIDAFRAAFQWCSFNIDFVRNTGRKNAQELYKTRRWEKTITYWKNVFRKALDQADG